MDCNIRIADIGKQTVDVYLPANKTYTIEIDYPFDEPGYFDIKTNSGMGFANLLTHIRKAYDKQYAAAKKSKTNGYWHGMEDLYLEGINVDHKTKKITLDIGS